MDIGIQVTCQRCTQKFNMYTETHTFKDGMVAGNCPLCSQKVTALIPGHHLHKVFEYNSGVEYASAVEQKG